MESFCETYDLIDEVYDSTWHSAYGVLEIGIVGNDDGSLSVDNRFSIWSPELDRYVEENISFDELKEICKKIDVDLKKLESKSSGKVSLDDRIAAAEAKVSDNKETRQKDENMFVK